MSRPDEPDRQGKEGPGNRGRLGKDRPGFKGQPSRIKADPAKTPQENGVAVRGTPK